MEIVYHRKYKWLKNLTETEKKKMDMKKRRDMQLAYISDEAVMEEQVKCRKILQKLNFADRSDFDEIAKTVKELLGKSDGAECSYLYGGASNLS